VAILLALVPLSFLSLYLPLEAALEKEVLKNHHLISEAKALVIQQRIQRTREGAESLSSRSMIRNKTSDFLEGKLNWEELQSYTEPKYLDGVRALDGIVYAGRWVSGRPLVETQNPAVDAYFDTHEHSKLFLCNKEIQSFISDSYRQVGIYSPIISGAQLLGYDLLVADLDYLIQQLHTTDMRIEIQHGQARNQAWQDGDYILTSHAIPSLNGIIFVTKTESSKLFAGIRKISTQSLIIFIVGLLLAIGLIYAILAVNAARSFRRLQRETEKAEAANEAKSRYLSHMNHEIRTPLNGLSGFTQLLENTSLNEEQQTFIKYINRSTAHMLSIVNNVLDHAKIETGGIVLDHCNFSLLQEVQTAIAPILALAAQKNLEVQTELADDLPDTVAGDPQRLRQIVMNLAGNAVKYTETGHIRISANCTESSADQVIFKLEIEDTGPGMSPETVKKIFQPFYQADDGTTRQSKGTGLGMAITHELVELMKGSIQIDSQPGQGTRVLVSLLLDKAKPC
ncbi:MAG: hypothetical protein D6B26_01715, partial [Spirochaetaceae bacterium]